MPCTRPNVMKVYNTAIYTGMPTNVESGLDQMALIGVNWYPDHLTMYPDREPSDASTEFVMCKATANWTIPQPIVLDIEHWPVTDPASVDKHVRLLEQAKRLSHGNSVGQWQVAPYNLQLGKFLASRGDESHPDVIAWEAINTQYQPVADVADALYPSLYTHTDNFTDWADHATFMVNKAKKMANGKPVRPFVCPQYMPTGYTTTPKAFLSGEYWSRQLNHLYNLQVEGVVIWGFYGTQMSTSDEWWVETLKFKSSLGGGIS